MSAAALSLLSAGFGSAAHAASASETLLGKQDVKNLVPLSRGEELAEGVSKTLETTQLPEVHQRTTVTMPEVQAERSPLNDL